MRATLKYDPATNAIIATEMPYSVFTDTVMDQLKALVENDPTYGIENAVDYTGDTAEIRIYLSKGINPNKMMAKLYHDTALESWFSINMVLLDQGRFPKVFGWREACNAYIEHIRACERNVLQWDLNKALASENIVNGLVIALANIDDVVAIIKGSDNPAAAAAALTAKYHFNKEQVDAILSMKLSALCRLDGIKLNDELAELKRTIGSLNHLLSDPTALDEKLISILNEVAQSFGDERRTRLEDSLTEEEEPEPIVEEDVKVLWSGNTIRMVKAKTAKKGKEIYTTNLGTLMLFTDAGKFYTASLSKLSYDKDYKMNEIFDCNAEKALLVESANTFNAYNSLTCVTQNNLIKKSSVNEYLVRSKKGSAAVKLDAGDKVVAWLLSSNANDRVVVKNGTHYCCYFLADLSATGRTTGVKAMKLAEGQQIKEAFLTTDETWPITGRMVKGLKY